MAIAVANRVCGEVPKPTQSGLRAMRVAARRIADALPEVIPNDLDVMPMRYTGNKRKRYLDAAEELRNYPITQADSGVSMFVKCERVIYKADKINPDPRPIQFRNPKYCVDIARFLRPIEEHLYNISGISKNVLRSRNIAKGLNSVERAELLHSKLQCFDDPVSYSLDMSRFDKHVSLEQLRCEHQVYIQCIDDRHFRQLLSWQLNNKCKSKNGMRYKTRGKRMSGDMNTALGNCIIALEMVDAWLRPLVRRFDVLDDGDDLIVIVEQFDVNVLNSTVKNTFLSFGHEVKVEQVTKEFHEIEFCQSRVIEYSSGKFKFVRNPGKVISNAMTGVKHFTDARSWSKLLCSIGMCELILNLGVPVLQEFSLAILRNCGVTKGFDLPSDGSLMSRVKREMRLYGLKSLVRVDPQEVTTEARASFFIAFGINESDQLIIESALRKWEFTLWNARQFPLELQPCWEWNSMLELDRYSL
jgi:hypothetical protein